MAPVGGEASSAIRARVEAARRSQLARQGKPNAAARHARDRPALRHRPRRRPAAAPCARAAAAFGARLSPGAARCAHHRGPRRRPRRSAPSTSPKRYSTGGSTPASRNAMATYAIGDVQGCYRRAAGSCSARSASRREPRPALVRRRSRQPRPEVARGAALRARASATRAVTVLGNHDLHLLAQYEGVEKRKRKDDTFHDVLDAPDAQGARSTGCASGR